MSLLSGSNLRFSHPKEINSCLTNGVLLFTIFTVLLPVSAMAQSIKPLIDQPVNEAQIEVLKGNTSRLAQSQFDRGAAPATLSMNRMLLVLKRSPEQDAALTKLLDDQQDKNSPSYHKWLTPEEFGKQFGPSDQDIQTIIAWLQSSGFQSVHVNNGRTMVEFSGTAAQVQQAFHTAIHSYVISGEQHWANQQDPSIPIALAPAVAGVLTLHNFFRKPQLHIAKERITAEYTAGVQPRTTFPGPPVLHALSPDDLVKIYNVPGSWNSGTAGKGIKIGVVARSDLYPIGSDIGDFRNVFSVCCGSFTTIINGEDPGDLGGIEEAEATLDVSWAGAIADGAQIDFVVSASTNTTDGVDLSELYIIDNNLADVMTESFGGCEADETSAEAAGISALAEQAAAEGITYVVSSGDNGAEGCDDPDTETVAQGPLSVNILAATPYTVAVGGTMFNEHGMDSLYWNSANNQITGASALSYIPENVWNESCLASQCGQDAGIWAGSGGVSQFFTKPSWQSGVSGIPADGMRDVPDVSLTAAGHDPYLLCLEYSCVPNSQGFISFAAISGTSASAPSFAGIMALVDQQMGGRQGLANYVLYRLAASQDPSQCNGSNTAGLPSSNCIFNDVTVGNNAVPGETGFGTTTASYQSALGYDLATGLGSVNVTNLVNSWNSITFTPTMTTLSLNSGNAVNVVHGTPVSVAINISPGSGTGTPSGDVVLIGSNSTMPATDAMFTLNSGTVNSTVGTLPGGNYNLTAHYAGDETFAPSNSLPVSVTVTAEPSTTTLSLFTTDASGSLIPFTTLPYSSFVYERVDVAGKSGQGVPTGQVSVSDPRGSFILTLNNVGNTATPQGTFSFSPRTYALTANYLGNASFAPSTSTPVNFSITPAPTTTTVSAGGSSSGATFTANITTNSGGDFSPGGTVTFFVNGKQDGNPVGAFSAGVTQVDPQQGRVIQGAQSQAVFTDSTLSNNTAYTITASYSGNSNYSGSSSQPVSITLQPDFAFNLNDNSIDIATPGQTGTFNVNVNFNDGFKGTVTLNPTCSGLPAEATCTFFPTSFTNTGSGTLTITTKAPVVARLHSPHSRWMALWSASGIMAYGGFWLFDISTKRRYKRRILHLVLFAFLTLGLGCGRGGNSPASGNNTGGNTNPDPGTPAGSYNVTVTAASGSISHSTSFKLVVQ